MDQAQEPQEFQVALSLTLRNMLGHCTFTEPRGNIRYFGIERVALVGGGATAYNDQGLATGRAAQGASGVSHLHATLLMLLLCPHKQEVFTQSIVPDT